MTGIDLDRKAAGFAKERLGLQRVLPLTIAGFVEQIANGHLTWSHFLKYWGIRLRQRTIALSVPNRERWLTGPDVLQTLARIKSGAGSCGISVRSDARV